MELVNDMYTSSSLFRPLLLAIACSVSTATIAQPPQDHSQPLISTSFTAAYSFAAEDIDSIAEKYVPDGLVVLQNKAGKAIYQLPIELGNRSRIVETKLTAKHIYLHIASGESSAILSCLRPTGKVSLDIPADVFQSFIEHRFGFEEPERAIARFLRDLHSGILAKDQQDALYNDIYRIQVSRTDGTYIGRSDADHDVQVLCTRLVKALRGALQGATLPSFGKSLDERPYVQLRNLTDTIGDKRLLTYFHIMRALTFSQSVRIDGSGHLDLNYERDRSPFLRNLQPDSFVALLPGFDTGDKICIKSGSSFEPEASQDIDVKS